MNQAGVNKTSHRARQNVALICFGIFLSVVIVESVLRLGGFIFYKIDERTSGEAFYFGDQKTDLLGDNTIRILALGESTTANNMHGQGSWPQFLEEQLNREVEAVNFRVINRGMIGLDTQAILRRLDEYIETYQPHIVITMMGINDNMLFPTPESPYSYKNLQTYKLGVWLWDAWQRKLGWSTAISVQPEMQKKTRAKLVPYLRKIAPLLRDGDYQEARRLATEAVEKNPDAYELYNLLGSIYASERSYSRAIEMLERSIRLNDRQEQIVTALAHTYKFVGQRVEAECMFRRSRELGVYVPDHYFRTVRNYRRLHDVLKASNIQYVAMEYPTRSIDGLKTLFSDQRDVVFISNENFLEALVGRAFEDYFVDRFGGTFGHATEKGNRLIAENASKVILERFDPSALLTKASAPARLDSDTKASTGPTHDEWLADRCEALASQAEEKLTPHHARKRST